MDSRIALLIITINILDCHGSSLSDQLERILRTRKFNEDYANDLQMSRRNLDVDDHDNYEINRRRILADDDDRDEYPLYRPLDNEQDKYSGAYKLLRRFYDFHPGMGSKILGAPSMPSHLPEAEAILPGHTLIRPALGMLKSAVKFPHKDLDNGAGVYGNIDSLGITYDGTGERVLYTGFRRSNDKNRYSRPRYFIAFLRPSDKKNKYENLNFENGEEQDAEVLREEETVSEEEREQENPKYKYLTEIFDKPIARIRDYRKLELERERMKSNGYNYYNNNDNDRNEWNKMYGSNIVETNGMVLQFIKKPKQNIPKYKASAPALVRRPALQNRGRFPRVVTPRRDKLIESKYMKYDTNVRPNIDFYTHKSNSYNYRPVHGIKRY